MIPLNKKVGYIVSMFPAIGRTFEMREMLALNLENFQVYVFSLRTPEDESCSCYAKNLLSKTFHSPFFLSLPLIGAQFHYIILRPRAYFKTLLYLLRTNWRTPIVLLRSMAIFPKSVHFARQMERLKIDHIHAHFIHIPTTAAIIISRLTGIPFSCTGHNSDIFQYPPADLEERIKLAAPFITISLFWKRYLTNLFGGKVGAKIEVVHCGIDLEEFHRIQPSQQNPIRLLTVARLEPIKGIRYLIEACHLLREKGIEFQCSIVGKGTKKKDLERQIHKNRLESLITFHGAVLPESTVDFYQKADIFVLPSLREGIPVAAMEAMAMELPVVSTNVFGIPELVENGVEGILVNPGDAKELACAIEALCLNRELRSRLGRNGRSKIEQDFNINKIAGRLTALFFKEEFSGTNQGSSLAPLKWS
jgi:glycosyltransferase involved in cell wall biosynthesis